MDKANYQKSFLRIETGGHSGEITELLVTSDATQIITSGIDKTIRVWDIKTQKETRKILGQIDSGNSGVIRAMALSPDDQYLVSAVYTGPGHKSNHPPYELNDVLIRIYDFEKGDIIRVFSPGNTNVVAALDISEDGKYLVSGSEDSTIKIWDFQELLKPDVDPKPFLVLQHGDYISRPNAFKLVKKENDYHLFIADFGEYSNWVSLYSIKEGRFLNAYKAGDKGHWLRYITVSDDYVAVCGNEHYILVFDHDLVLKKKIISEPNPEDVIFSPDGKYLLAGAKETTDSHPIHCYVYDVENNFKRITSFKKHDARSQAVEFINNRTALTCGGNRKEMYFWDIITGEIKGEIIPVGSTIYALGLNGKRIAFGFTEDFKKDKNNYAPLEKVFDLETFTISDFDPEEKDQFLRAREEKDGMKLFIDPYSAWDLFLERDNNAYRMYRDGGWYYHEAYGFTDSDMIVTGGRGGEVRAYSRDGYSKAKFIGHAGKIWDLATQNNWMVTGGVEQVIKLWNLDPLSNDQEEIYPMLNIFISTENEWVVWSQHGYYHASTNGDKHIGYHINQGELEEAIFYTSDRFIKALFRPDIIKSIIETGSEDLTLKKFNINLSQQVEHMLPPSVKLSGSRYLKTKNRTVDISFTVKELSDPPVRVWILKNDNFLWEKRGEDGKVEGKYTQNLPLDPGVNVFKILAESHISKSNPVVVTVEADLPDVVERGGFKLNKKPDKDALKKIEPNLYLLAVGVSKYKKTGNIKDLNYAHADAEKVQASFEKQSGKLFNSVSSKLLTNEKATRENIMAAVTWLKNAILDRDKSKKENNEISRDICVVFLAGHGIKKNEKFYFLNHDCDLDDLDNTAISLLNFADIITSFSSEVVIFTDACHAGKISTDLLELIDSNELNKRISAIHERAQVILNATTAGMPAYELRDEEHGIFTKVLLDGLEDREEVTILHLADFVSYNVKRKTKDFPKGAQKPILTIFGSLDNYEIYLND